MGHERISPYQESIGGNPFGIFVGARFANGELTAVVTTEPVVCWVGALSLLESGELLVLLFALGDRRYSVGK